MMGTVNRCLAAVAFLLLSTGSSLAAGTAVVVDPDATVRTGGQQRTLLTGDPVEVGDLVQTAANGHVELAFDDGTKIVVGPGSSLLIQDYLLRRDGSAGNFAINALGGTYRFISGKSAKDRYKITTPAGTIGIRGTEFDLFAERGRSARVLMYSGATELCPSSGNCKVIADVCELGEMVEREASSIGLTTQLSGADRRTLRSQFVYGGSQQSLSSSHRLYAAGRCLLSPFPGTSEFFATLSDEPREISLTLGQQENGQEPDAPPDRERPAGAPTPKPAVDKDDAPLEVVDDGGSECAGRSDHNPGKSQNCTGKK